MVSNCINNTDICNKMFSKWTIWLNNKLNITKFLFLIIRSYNESYRRKIFRILSKHSYATNILLQLFLPKVLVKQLLVSCLCSIIQPISQTVIMPRHDVTPIYSIIWLARKLVIHETDIMSLHKKAFFWQYICHKLFM